MSYFEDWMAVRGLSFDDIEKIRAGSFDYDINDEFLGEYHFSDKLNEYFERGLVITICPDYDADGIMAGTLFYAALSELGFSNVHCYFPIQETGYGLTEASAEALLLEYPDTQVVVTCDNGIHSDLAVERFKRDNIPVLITDHHPSNTKPDAMACVDPSFVDDEYPFKGLSGATVLWKVLCRYAEKYAPDKLRNIRSLAVFAGISAVTDSMPMLEENRNLVRLAFSTIRSLWLRSGCGDHFPEDMLRGFSPATVRAFEGLYHLVKVIAENGGKPAIADETFFGFSIGPILNSARRVNLDSTAAFDVFVGNTDACESAKHLYELNQMRKDIVGPLSECAIVNSGVELTTGLIGEVSAVSCAFCYGADGCLGLISSALTNYTGYPSVCFLLSDDNYRGEYDSPFIADNSSVLSGIVSDWVKGSARAPGWFDFYSFVDYFDNRYPGAVRFGGHGQAGSFAVLTRFVSEFSRELFHFAIEVLKLVPPGDIIPPYDLGVFMGDDLELLGDAILLDDEHFNEWVDFSGNLDSLKPFGEGFPKPSFRVVVDVASRDLAIQYLSAGKHLKCSFKGYDLILWNCGESFSTDKPLQFYADATLGVNEFRGKKMITFYGNSYSKITHEVDNVFDIHVDSSELLFGVL